MTVPHARSGAGAGLLVDAHGLIREWSAEAEELLGYPAAEVLGRPVTELLAEPGLTTAPGEPVAVLRHRSGLPLEVEIRIHPEADRDGAPTWSVLLTAAGGPGLRSVDRAVLRALFTESPVGLHILDPDLRLVRFNTASQGMRGVPADEVVGRRLRDVAPGVVTDAIEQILRHVLDTGEPVIDFVQPGYPPSDPGHQRVFSMSAFRLQDDAARVLGVAGVVIDATERYRDRARLDLLNDASTRVGTTLDVLRTAEELAEIAVPRVADAVAVDVLDSVFHGEAPGPGPVADNVTLRHAAFRSMHSDLRPAYATGEVSSFSFPTPFTQCLTDLRPRLVPHLDEGSEWLVHDPVRAEQIRSGQVHSLIVVPLSARGVVLGLVGFYRSRTAEPFEADDLTIATELAARAALCVDNARRYTREHTAALALQRSLLPQQLPTQTAVELAYCLIPDGAGGSWFDVIPLPGARVALVVGDVQGHGMPAVATMGRLRAAIHSLAGLDLAPDELLAHVDDLMVRLSEDQQQFARSDPLAAEAADATGATCVYAVYDPISRHCVLARAGHPAPVIAYPDGAVEVADVPGGPALGVGHEPLEAAELELPEGTLLALHTEGLVRARGDPQTGLLRLQRLLAHPEAAVQDTCDAVIYGQLTDHPKEGVVLLLARTRALSADRVASWTLPSDPAIVSTVRTLVDRQLATWGLQELDFTTKLVASELVTNAIRYGIEPIRLRLIRDRTLICEVSDGSSTAPHVRHPRTTDEGGRGLLLIAQLTQRWGTRHTADGKIVWAEQTLPGVGASEAVSGLLDGEVEEVGRA